MSLMRYRPSGASPSDGRLGRFIPDDDRHIRGFPAREVLPATVTVVNKTLILPSWHWDHDQWNEGSCVGHGVSMERAISNLAQNRLLAQKPYTRRYDPIDCWDWAKANDEWPETNPGDDNGTSVRAGYEYQRVLGARRIKTTRSIVRGTDGKLVVVDRTYANDLQEGVQTYRWATTVDQMRTALASGIPVVIGVNWYDLCDQPEKRADGQWWIRETSWGRIRGGHCVCLYGASDKRQAFRLKNSWGRDYPLVWLPYSVMDRLLQEQGEAALVTDR